MNRKTAAFIQLNALCAAMGVDLDDVIERANGECHACGHGRDSHDNSEPTECGEDGCECGGFMIPQSKDGPR